MYLFIFLEHFLQEFISGYIFLLPTCGGTSAVGKHEIVCPVAIGDNGTICLDSKFQMMRRLPVSGCFL